MPENVCFMPYTAKVYMLNVYTLCKNNISRHPLLISGRPDLQSHTTARKYYFKINTMM